MQCPAVLDIAVIVVGQIRKHESRCQPHLLRLRMLVSITRTDGTSRQYGDISESPLKVAAQFNLRGYPVSA